MGMHQDLSIDSNLIKAIVAGDFSVAEAKKIFVELLDFVERHKSRKVLFDGRGIIGNPTVIDRFYYSSFVAHQACRLSQRALFAYVLKPPVLDEQRFGETVAVNRGMAVKAFENVEEAVEWLG